MKAPRIMIMAGGTGGHVFPGLAVAEQLSARGWDIEWFGTAAGIESRLVPAAGYPLHLLGVNGIRGKGLATVLKAPFMLLQSVWQAMRLLRERKPSCVLGMGGFASGPGGLAARLQGIPVLVHEQNAVLGSTNKLLQYLATRRLEAFPNTFARRVSTYFTGNPVRFSACEASKVAQDHRRVLIVGGSRGAQALNEHLPVLLGNIQRETGLVLKVLHQTGERDVAVVEQRYVEQGLTADVAAFVDDMAAAYADADLVICRAGAMTVAELAVAGRAALLVPYPHAIDDHQTSNALWLVDQGAAMLMPQHSLQQSMAQPQLSQLLNDPEKLAAMAAAAKKAAISDAAENVASHCMEVCA